MIKSIFDTILLLKKRLPFENEIEVMHGDFIWKAKFIWNTPNENIITENEPDIPLPKDYLRFIKEIANGCTLFYDVSFGQWGYKIYSYEELMNKQDLWKNNLGVKWQKNFIAFAELFGEANVLIFDTNSPSNDLQGYAIREGNPYCKVEDWPIISQSFHLWLDHLITAQGAKYWEWT